MFLVSSNYIGVVFLAPLYSFTEFTRLSIFYWLSLWSTECHSRFSEEDICDFCLYFFMNTTGCLLLIVFSLTSSETADRYVGINSLLLFKGPKPLENCLRGDLTLNLDIYLDSDMYRYSACFCWAFTST